MALLDNRYPDRADMGGSADVYEGWRSGMTDWREELIEKMARSICDLYKLNPNDWRSWRKECRAALDVAEPVIREQCAEIADREANTDTGFETSDFLDGIAFGARVIAAAIREGGREK